MYEERTFEWCLKRALARVPDNVSKRPGDIVYDMLSPVCWEMSELYHALSVMQELVFLATSREDYLDAWGWQTGLDRTPATPSRYAFAYEGTEPPLGTRFFAERQYFVLIRDEETGSLLLESEATGRNTTAILVGTPAVPCQTIQGLTRAAFGALLSAGVDEEDDEHFRERIREKLVGPAANGNRQHYKTWCESTTGVGRAKIIPLFAGENTVMAVLFDPDGKPVMEDVIDAVQEYVDPMTRGCTVKYEGEDIAIGDGTGNGKANIGAHFLAVAAEPVDISVSFTAYLAEGGTMAQAKKEAQAAIERYFRDIALSNMNSAGTAIRISAIGAALVEHCPALADYGELKLNGEAKNVLVGLTCAPILTEVTLNAAV